jgi:transcriptional regulator with XRE-family HTH domain
MSVPELEFGQLLRETRIAAKLTQEELADRASISVDAIRRLESGTRRAPYRDTVTRLVRALELDDGTARNLIAAADRARRRGPALSSESFATDRAEAVNVPRGPRNVVWVAAFAVFLVVVAAIVIIRESSELSHEHRASAQSEPADAVKAVTTPRFRGAPKLHITEPAQCTTDWSERVQNNTHGTVSLASGTNSFAGLGPQHKQLDAVHGSRLSGKVMLIVLNGGAPFAVAPLVYTPTWGAPEDSWRLIAPWVPDGTKLYTPIVQLASPSIPGLYHIVFAYQLEKTGADVASATSWFLRRDVWGDGDDLADWSSEQISEAQRFGCTTAMWLSQFGYLVESVPADAITLRVR